MRFALEPHRELSTRAGRRFAKPAEGDEIVGVARVIKRQRRRLRRHQRRARADVQGRRAARAGQPRPRRHRHQGGRRDGGRLRRRAREGQGRPHRRDRRRQGAARRSGPLPRHLARRQGPRAQAQDQDRARDLGRAARAAAAARRCSTEMDMASTSYTSDHITVLEGLEPVRRRPGMYIGGTDSKGYHHLLWEIVDNSVDEVINGYGSRIEVTLHKDGKIAHRRGRRPRHSRRHQEGVQEVGAGAGADHAARGRQVRRGRSTSSRAACTASARRWSTRCRKRWSAQVKRDSTRWEQSYERGKATSKLTKVGPARGTGTTITFRPDPQIFGKQQFSAGDDPLPAGRQGVPAQGPHDRLHRRGRRARRRRFEHAGGIADFLTKMSPSAASRRPRRRSSTSSAPARRASASRRRCSGPSRTRRRSART